MVWIDSYKLTETVVQIKRFVPKADSFLKTASLKAKFFMGAISNLGLCTRLILSKM